MFENLSNREFRRLRAEFLATIKSDKSTATEREQARVKLVKLRGLYDGEGRPRNKRPEVVGGPGDEDAPKPCDPRLTELFTPGISEERAKEIQAEFRREAEERGDVVEERKPLPYTVEIWLPKKSLIQE